jgi:serine/threonine protein kinase
MPVKLTVGEVIASPTDRYTVEEVLTQGFFTHSARAKSQALGGVNVIIKRYMSPTQRLPWYQAFVEHQDTLRQRILSSDSLREVCVEPIEFFEGSEGRAKMAFHQVFEFVANGKSLTKFLEEMTDASTDLALRLRTAWLMMNGVAVLHSHDIVHTDLKPDNQILILNSESPDAFQLKLKTLDWAIFSNEKAPWHGEMGYVGTPGYESPEHLADKVPTKASDVFTCALVLGELLGEGHPFRGKRVDARSYAQAVLAGDFEPFRLRDLEGDQVELKELEDLVNRALAPIPSDRPSAKDLADVLSRAISIAGHGHPH